MDEALCHMLLPCWLCAAARQPGMVSTTFHASLAHAHTAYTCLRTLAPLDSVHGRVCDRRHGGTPNLSQYTRAIPSARYTLQSPEQKAATIGTIGDGSKIPWETWKRMTEQGKHICRHIVAEPGVRCLPPRLPMCASARTMVSALCHSACVDR